MSSRIDTFSLPSDAVTIVKGILILISCIVGILVYQFVYNLCFHPLQKYPGPFWAKISTIWRFYHSMGGRWHRVVEDCHRKYGDVFRVGPNELSFASVSAFRTIYGNRTAASPNSPAPKNEWYDMLSSGFGESCVASERDPRKAAAKRALFSAAFTQKALLEQEGIIQSCINGFVEKLGKAGVGPDGVNMVKWYEMISFDIFGVLGLGESFGCVERESSHHWLEMILDHLLVVNIMDNLRHYPFLVQAARSLPAKWTTGLAKKQMQFSRDKVQQRLARGTEQRDFLTNVVRKVELGEVSQEEMAAHASTLVMAGGETTSTSMAAITFYLLKTPSAHKKIQNEIRGHYKTLEEIDIVSTSQLPYLQAVIKEGMRMFPAGPQGLPRRSTGMEVDGHFVPEGTEFYVSSWTVAHDERYFHEPYSFIPERWIDPNCKDMKDASQPFSLGPRMCIGRTFAYAQMSLELAKMIWKYDMELVDKNLDFEAASRMYFQWRKPKMYIRFIEQEG